MNRNVLAMAALRLGSAFLMRNKEKREKLKDQVNNFTKNDDGKGLLDQVLGSLEKNHCSLSSGFLYLVLIHPHGKISTTYFSSNFLISSNLKL